MQWHAPVLMVGGATDCAILVLLGIIAMIIGLVAALYKGRHPRDVRVERYRDGHRMDDPVIPWKVLGEVQDCLRKADYDGAHTCMLTHTNWFFLHRLYLPAEFSNLWLVLRNRVNRMMTVHKWPQDWAQRDVERMRTEALRLVEKAIAVLGELPAPEAVEEVFEEVPFPQSVRTMSAPSDRSLSSMRS